MKDQFMQSITMGGIRDIVMSAYLHFLWK